MSKDEFAEYGHSANESHGEGECCDANEDGAAAGEAAADAAAADDFKKNALKLAKPAGVKLFIKPVEKAAKALNNPINDGKRIFVVTQTVEDAERLYSLLDDAHKFSKLNIGTAGVNKKPGEKYVAIIPQVYTTAEEFAAAKKLHDAGVNVFGQANPTLEKADFAAIEHALN